MDRIVRYRKLVKRILCCIAAEIPREADIRTELILDEVHDHYEILEAGWDGPRRVHGSLIHCDIRDQKIYIEHDGTDIGVADLLLANEVPHEDIVLGFHPPQLRKLTPFATA